MKHPFWDRLLILLCAIVALAGATGLGFMVAGRITPTDVASYIQRIDLFQPIVKAIVIAAIVVLCLIALLLLSAMLPARKKRSSSFAVQHNEHGTVRISLKALEALVSKCLDQHGELKVITSSLYSDEESIRVDVHISLQSDISMPLAIAALQKQIKRYMEACSGVSVQEVRIFVDNTIPSTEETPQSPYAIPASLFSYPADTLIDAAQTEEIGEEDPAQKPDTSEEADEEPSAPHHSASESEPCEEEV